MSDEIETHGSFSPVDTSPLVPIDSVGTENVWLADTLNKQILECMELYGFSLNSIKTIFEGDVLSTNDKCKLNYAIRMVKKLQYIPIKDVILCFETFAPMNKVLNHIDDETRSQLKTELSIEHHIPLDENELYD